MISHEIMPGYHITSDIYEAVRSALAELAPDQVPGWEQITQAKAYAIPDRAGAVSKVELILADTPALTIKVNNWHLPDLRSGEQPAPHNHRWRTMSSRILAGGYRDHVYWAEGRGVADEIRTHDAGSLNVVEHHEFHEVDEVEPGATWTCFVGTRSQPGDWGYLDPELGIFTHSSSMAPDPNFRDAFRALNPHITHH